MGTLAMQVSGMIHLVRGDLDGIPDQFPPRFQRCNLADRNPPQQRLQFFAEPNYFRLGLRNLRPRLGVRNLEASHDPRPISRLSTRLAWLIARDWHSTETQRGTPLSQRPIRLVQSARSRT
jgi:hypothetical protein